MGDTKRVTKNLDDKNMTVVNLQAQVKTLECKI